MKNIMVDQSKYVSSDFQETPYQVAFEDLKKEILVGHQEITQGKVSSLADVRMEFGLDQEVAILSLLLVIEISGVS